MNATDAAENTRNPPKLVCPRQNQNSYRSWDFVKFQQGKTTYDRKETA